MSSVILLYIIAISRTTWFSLRVNIQHLSYTSVCALMTYCLSLLKVDVWERGGCRMFEFIGWCITGVVITAQNDSRGLKLRCVAVATQQHCDIVLLMSAGLVTYACTYSVL